MAGNTTAGGDDIFIAKYDSSGTQVWVKQFGTTASDIGNGIALDSSGNSYVTGQAGSGVAFAGNTSAGSTDVFTLRLDVLGNTYY